MGSEPVTFSACMRRKADVLPISMGPFRRNTRPRGRGLDTNDPCTVTLIVLE